MGLVLSLNGGIVVVFFVVVFVVVKSKMEWKFWLLTFSARLRSLRSIGISVCIAGFVVPSFSFHKTIIILNGWQMADMHQSAHHHWVQWKYTIPTDWPLIFSFSFHFKIKRRKIFKLHTERKSNCTYRLLINKKIKPPLK